MNDAVNAEIFFAELKKRFTELLEREGILGEEIEIGTRSLSPREAIGDTKRRDFPIINGKDVMVQAKCMGSLGLSDLVPISTSSPRIPSRSRSSVKRFLSSAKNISAFTATLIIISFLKTPQPHRNNVP